MEDAEISDRLRDVGTGVLGLATGRDAYAIPIAHYYDGESLYFRLGRTEHSEKWEAIEKTETASYVVHGTEPTDDPKELESWSIVVRGPLSPVPESEHGRFDAAAINEQFAPIRVFDEPIEDVEIVILELEMDSITGRTTIDGEA
jgi:hypothetical protein